MMDTAFILKQQYDSGEITDKSESLKLLEKSELINELTGDFDFDILNLLNRLTELTEIPFVNQLNRVQKWTEQLARLSYCGDGFSITGKSDDILSCYNSMITSILIRLNYQDQQYIPRELTGFYNTSM
ncbi:MAG: hypothetical protein HC830_05510 [Bacteroidetes bacterium]|nr:hypothetical protein [Bacteroidota bacterium]